LKQNIFQILYIEGKRGGTTSVINFSGWVVRFVQNNISNQLIFEEEIVSSSELYATLNNTLDNGIRTN
jgi:hypothetical protein